MTDKKISALTSATTLVGTEVLPIVQSGSTVKTTVNSLGVPLGAVTIYTPAGDDAVATTVQNKLRESISVKDFGAACDGVKYCDGVLSGASVNVLSSASYTFTSADVGSLILCQGLNSSYPTHYSKTTITSVSAGAATLSLSGTTFNSGITFYMGTDDYEAVTAANNQAKLVNCNLVFPSGICLLMSGDGNIVVNSNCVYSGEGPSSEIVSFNNVFYNSGFETSTLGSLTSYPVNAITALDAGFTMTSAGNATNFAPGSLVYVCKFGSAYGVSPNYGVPVFGQLCKVVYFNASTGFVGIQGCFEESITGCIAIPAPEEVPDSAVIQDMKITCSSRPWYSDGSYLCQLRNLQLDCATLFSSNLATHFRAFNLYGILRVGGSATGNLIEFALNSYDCYIDQVNFQYIQHAARASDNNMVMVHENSRECHVENLRVEANGISFEQIFSCIASIKASICKFHVSCARITYYGVYAFNSLSQPTSSGVTQVRLRVLDGIIKISSGGFACGVGLNADTGTVFNDAVIDRFTIEGSASLSPGYSVFYTGSGQFTNTNVMNSVIDGLVQYNSNSGNRNLLQNLSVTAPAQTALAASSAFIFDRVHRSANLTFEGAVLAGYMTTTVTTSGNPICTLNIPAGSVLMPGDSIRVKAKGTTYSGTPGANLAIVVDGTVYGTFATSGPFTYEAELVFLSGATSYPYSPTNLAISSSAFNSSATTAQFSVPGITSANAHTISFAGWVTGSGATLEITKASVEHVNLENQ